MGNIRRNPRQKKGYLQIDTTRLAKELYSQIPEYVRIIYLYLKKFKGKDYNKRLWAQVMVNMLVICKFDLLAGNRHTCAWLNWLLYSVLFVMYQFG